MARKLTNNNAHFKRAVQRLPLGVASNFRYWGDDRTIYVKQGKGARIVDLDDNVYVDYRMGYGPAILGYADERVDAAAREGMNVGGVFALGTERELNVANRISKMVPAAELVRFSNSGTEAVMAGLRVARAFTGKDDYVILEGGYHGLFDAAMWFTPMDKWSQVGDPEVKPYSEGVPLSTKSFAHFVQANDANQLEDVLRRFGHRIACLLIEPIMGNCLGIAAEPEYLRAARQLCDKHGVVLLIDEVKTGFRVARGGVQELYGVKADLCTFAKAVANVIRFRCSPAARILCARSAAGLRMAALTPRIRCRWRRPRPACRFSTRPMRWSALPSTGRSSVTACGRYSPRAALPIASWVIRP